MYIHSIIYLLFTCIHIHIHIHTRTHTHIYIYIYIYIYMYREREIHVHGWLHACRADLAQMYVDDVAGAGAHIYRI